MARPPEFDRTEVLTKAMNAFWRNGFNGVSITDLEAAMGLRRASIYAAFGDKSMLFHSALECYRDTELAKVLAALDGGSSGKKAIEKRFESIIDLHEVEDSWIGCLMVNSIIELNGSEEYGDCKSKLESMRQEMESAYLRAVRRGKDSGEICSKVPSIKLARNLTSLDMALAVLLRLRVAKKVLQDSVAPTLSLLN